MEADVHQATPVVEAQSEEARLNLAEHVAIILRHGYENIRRNLRTYAAIGASAFALSGASAELVLNPESVSADTTPTTQVQPGSQEQACIQEGLAFPTYTDVRMVNPGHKPLDQQDLPYEQGIGGEFNYPAAPDCLPIDYMRIAGGQLQQQSNHNHHIWVNIPKRFKWNPGCIGDNASPAELDYTPPHPYPAKLFDEYIPGEGYGKARDILTEIVRDEALPGHPIVAESHKTIPIPVIAKSR